MMEKLKKYSFWVILGVLILILAGVALWQNQTAPKISEDALSRGISQRWNGGLPAGFAKQEAADTDEDGDGFLFARLVYPEDIRKLLERWEPAEDGTAARFDAILDGYLESDVITEASRDVVEQGRPADSEPLVGFAMSKPETGAEIVLLYDDASYTMYVAERLAAAETQGGTE